MVEADDIDAAKAFQRTVRPIIESHAPIARSEVDQYWKISDWYEITFELRPTDDPTRVYRDLLGLGDGGWTSYGDATDRSSAWNPTSGSELLSHRVRWAELQCCVR